MTVIKHNIAFQESTNHFLYQILHTVTKNLMFCNISEKLLIYFTNFY